MHGNKRSSIKLNTPKTPEPVRGCADCYPGVPCKHGDSVDLRVILLAYNRPLSLQTSLRHVDRLIMDGHSLSIHVFLDRSKDGTYHNETYNMAKNFKKERNSKGSFCIHIQKEHAYATKQWLLSWRPEPNSTEIGLIVEDDIDISPYAYRWLKAVHNEYGSNDNVFGYTLQSENVRFPLHPFATASGPESDPIFLMPFWGTWGFAPKADFWIRLQDFYLKKKEVRGFKPSFKGLKCDVWYDEFLKKGREESMAHELWVMHFINNHKKKQFCVFSNLQRYKGFQGPSQLSVHRAEKGMHYHGNHVKEGTEVTNKLLETWDTTFSDFKDIHPMDGNGNQIQGY